MEKIKNLIIIMITIGGMFYFYSKNRVSDNELKKNNSTTVGKINFHKRSVAVVEAPNFHQEIENPNPAIEIKVRKEESTNQDSSVKVVESIENKKAYEKILKQYSLEEVDKLSAFCTVDTVSSCSLCENGINCIDERDTLEIEFASQYFNQFFNNKEELIEYKNQQGIDSDSESDSNTEFAENYINTFNEFINYKGINCYTKNLKDCRQSMYIRKVEAQEREYLKQKLNNLIKNL